MNIIFLIFIMMGNNTQAEEIYWKYFYTPKLTSPYVGHYDPSHGRYNHVATLEEFADSNEMMVFVTCDEENNCYEELVKRKQFTKNQELLSKFMQNDNFVVIASVYEDKPILVALPSYIYIPKNKIYSIKYGKQTTFSQKNDFWKGFISGVKYVFTRNYYNISRKLFVKTFDKYLFFLTADTREFMIEVIQCLTHIEDYDTAILLINTYDEPNTLEEIYEALEYSYSKLPEAIVHQLKLRTQPIRFIERDEYYNKKINRIESLSFRQSLEAENGRGFKNYFFRNSTKIGELSVILIIGVFIILIIKWVRREVS